MLNHKVTKIVGLLCFFVTFLSEAQGYRSSTTNYPVIVHNFYDSLEGENDPSFPSLRAQQKWLHAMSIRLKPWMKNAKERIFFLKRLHYEAVRANLDPQLVLAIIHVESCFNRYAVSPVGARGYMQVMPFWVHLIGQDTDNLFDTGTSLRYGCSILRYYLKKDKGNVLKALASYNGSPEHVNYPYKVWKFWKTFWRYS